jgi:ATP-dependent DNA helicase RecQ
VRTEWRERAPRGDWAIRYTPIGGRGSLDPLALFGPTYQTVIRRALSQVMCASSLPDAVGSSDACYLASVITKLVQRGSSPRLFHHDISSLDVDSPSVEALLAAVVGRSDSQWALDPAITLDPTWEIPFWQMILEKAPPLSRWVTPQAWFEGLTKGDPEGRRWVDFLVHFPWARPAVIELDGAGHSRQRLLDARRTRSLEALNFRVDRLAGAQSLDESHETVKELLRNVERPALKGSDEELLRAVHGPAALHRFVVAVALALESGVLHRGVDWSIDLLDQTGVVGDFANVALDLISSVDDVWGLELVPDTVWIGEACWVRGDDRRFKRLKIVGQRPSPALSIRLEPFVPPHAVLPDSSSVPSVVIRGCLLPVDLEWLRSSEVQRRDRESDDLSLAALDRLLADLFGHDGYREGQREAVSRLLSGGDSLVLLPTGAGKTLIYQMAGLLRPGVTVVVSPLKALIDDQERRLAEQGTDRVIGLHSGRKLERHERREIQESIGGGEALFVLVAPERFQIAEFRTHVSNAASDFMVNLAVVDEAHCVSEWGHQFRTSYLRLGRNLRRICAGSDDVSPPLLALTATASPRVLADVRLELDFDEADPGLMFRPANFRRPNLHYKVFRTTADQRANTIHGVVDWVAEHFGVAPADLGLVRGSDTKSGIVFVPHGSSGLGLGVATFRREMMEALGLTHVESVAVYAGTRPKDLAVVENWESDKARYAEDFRRNDRPVMVSTNAFGMGIDKPNIRYTIHVALPSSIEGFAQESGRAGRDGFDSLCALIAPLDVESGFRKIDERQNGPEAYAKDDVGIQLSFLHDSFESPTVELECTMQVLGELFIDSSVAERGGMTVVVPMNIQEHDNKRSAELEKMRRERALFRLLNMGVIDDYTVEYGTQSFTVYFAYFSSDSLVESARGFVSRVTGGNREIMNRIANSAPGESALHVALRSAEIVVEAVYERIEPARAMALREMLTLSSLDDPDAITERINAYLSEGPVAAMLDRLVRRDSTILECLASLSEITPDEFEWIGAATRFLESYPDHPVLLAVRALGEAWQVGGSRSEFARLIAAFLDAVVDFGLDDDEVEEIVAWVLRLLRQYFDGRRSEWCVVVWEALEASRLGDDLAQRAEYEALDEVRAGRMHELEIDMVLARQVRRVTRRLREITEDSVEQGG